MKFFVVSQAVEFRFCQIIRRPVFYVVDSENWDDQKLVQKHGEYDDIGVATLYCRRKAEELSPDYTEHHGFHTINAAEIDLEMAPFGTHVFCPGAYPVVSEYKAAELIMSAGIIDCLISNWPPETIFDVAKNITLTIRRDVSEKIVAKSLNLIKQDLGYCGTLTEWLGSMGFSELAVAQIVVELKTRSN